ncbi:MAG: MFS transporter [Capsulimonadaceae bacterium]|nr:MFS transporter [Capsulimonadaceae bacterium]
MPIFAVKQLPSMFRALQSRNYRLFFCGQSLSLIGTWMTRVATSWLIYKLTGSAILLGTLGFATQIPTFILAPFAGVLVDRWDRYRIMVSTQTLSMIQSFLLALLTLTHVITVWEVIALGVFQGLINAFDTPARQSFMIRMVDNHEDLGNAIALNSSMVNSARLIGPSIAGIIIAMAGEGTCFFVDGVSYVAVIASLLMMRIDGTPVSLGQNSLSILKSMTEGWRYVSTFLPIRHLLTLLALISLLGMPYTVLLPVFATHSLHGGPKTLGWLNAAVGSGALIGAWSLAARKSVLGLGRKIAWAAVIFGSGLVGFSQSHILWVSLLLLMITGYGFIAQLASGNTIMQTVVDDEKRGRVMSFYTMAFVGTTPFGSLLAGFMAAHFGAPMTLAVCGTLCIAGGIWFASGLTAFRRDLHPIYIRLGLVKASSDQTVVEVENVVSPPVEEVVEE